MSKLEDMLIRHEGLRLRLYPCPSGKLTIGVGRNIEDNGILQSEAMTMLNNDILQAQTDLMQAIGTKAFGALNEARHDALVDMVFNIGLTRFLGFKNLIAALKRQDWDAASREMLDSKWAVQVGDRAHELSQMVLTGEYQGAAQTT